MIEHDGCAGCLWEHDNADSAHCSGCVQNAIDKYAPMTNAAKIRAMSDEELADFLNEATRQCQYGCTDKEDCDYDDCQEFCRYQAGLAWLRQPAKEDSDA